MHYGKWMDGFYLVQIGLFNSTNSMIFSSSGPIQALSKSRDLGAQDTGKKIRRYTFKIVSTFTVLSGPYYQGANNTS